MFLSPDIAVPREGGEIIQQLRQASGDELRNWKEETISHRKHHSISETLNLKSTCGRADISHHTVI